MVAGSTGCRVWLVAVCLGLTACPESVVLQKSVRQAEVDRKVLDLGETEAGQPVYGVVRFRNMGDGTVNANLSLSPGDGPFLLPFRQYVADSDWRSVRVGMLAFEPGEYTGTLTFHTNSQETKVFQVELRGRVPEPPNCDDGNPCTLDLTHGRSCEHVDIHGPCSDGDACTDADSCVAGRCVGVPRTCNDNVECTVDACDPVLGCLHTPRNEVCDDGLPCTVDVCDPVGGCTNAVMPDGTLCGLPTCSDMPVCAGGQCHTTLAPDGFPCEDGNPCTLGDHCLAGTCEHGPGQELGVGDPIVVGAGQTGPQGVAVEPVELGGIQPLGDGVVRVAWRGAPVGAELCPDGSCDPGAEACAPALRATHGGFALFVTQVDDQGRVRHQVELPAPSPGAAAVALRAAPAGDGMLVLAQFRDRPPCCTGWNCPATPLTATTALYRVHGTDVEGPVLVQALDLSTLALKHDERLPLALAVSGRTAVLVASRPQPRECSGECPPLLRMLVYRVDLSVAPPALGTVSGVDVELPAGAEGLRTVADAALGIHGGGLLLAWRTTPTLGGTVLSCGAVDDRAWTGHLWRGALDSPELGSVEELPSTLGTLRSVGVADGLLGNVVFLDDQALLPADGPDGGCSAQDQLGARQGSQRVHLADLQSPSGEGAVVSLGTGSAFGRAVGVALRADGEAVLVSPPLGVTPALVAHFAPPQDVPVHLVAGGVPQVAQDGVKAWLGALLRVDVPLFPVQAVALVEAGCGLRPSGRILGWPPAPADGGVPDGGGLERLPPDGGAVLHAGADAGREFREP